MHYALGRSARLAQAVLPSPALAPLRPWLLALALALPAGASFAQAPTPPQPVADAADAALQPRPFDVPAGALAPALNLFAEQSGWQLIYPGELTAARRTAGVRGRHAPMAALEMLLRGSGLAARRTGAASVTLEPAPPSQAGAAVLAPVRVQGQSPAQAGMYEGAGSVSVIGREQLDRLPATSARDIFNDTTGVWVQDGRQNPALNINIRGLQDQGRVNVMIDGARQNLQVVNGHNGLNQFVYVDPELLYDVRIEKGPTATEHGAAQIAGTVDLRTLEPGDVLDDDQDLGGRLRLIGGDNGYRAAGSAVVAGRATPRTRLLAAISRRDSDDYRAGDGDVRIAPAGGVANVVEPGATVENTFQRSTAGLLKSETRLGDAQTVKLGAVLYSGTYGQQDLANPGGSVNRARTQTYTADYRYTPQANDWLDFGARGWFTDAEVERPEYATTYEMRTWGGELTNRSLLALPWFDAELRYGTEFFRDDSRSVTENLAGYGAATAGGERTVASGFSRVALRRGEWLELAGGWRYDWYGLRGSGRYLAPVVYGGYIPFTLDRHEGKGSPSASLTLTPLSYLSLYLQYSEGLRPPAITETLMGGCHGSCQGFFPFLPNPDLQAERARNREAGVSVNGQGLWHDDDRLRAKLSWFDNHVRNFIAFEGIHYPTGGATDYALRYQNIGYADYRGFELQADYDAGIVFALLAWTRFIDKRYCDQGRCESERGFFDPPNSSLRATLGTRWLARRLTLGTRYRYDQGYSEYRLSASIFDLFARYELDAHTEFGLAVENLDDVYYADAMSGIRAPAPGRSFKGTVTYRF